MGEEAGVQYAEKLSLRMLRAFRKMADASFECALYTPCMLIQRDGVWSVDVHPLDNPAIEYNHGTLRRWIVECRKHNSRMLVVHVVVDVQNSNESWVHSTAVTIDLERKTACASEANGPSGMHGYTVATTAGAPFTQITLHDLYAKHGIGKRLFADITGLKWIPQYKRDRVMEGLQMWLEEGTRSPSPPWWCDHIGNAACGGCDMVYEDPNRPGEMAKDKEGHFALKSVPIPDVKGICVALTLLTWIVCKRLDFYDTGIVAVVVREVMEEFVEECRARNPIGITQVQCKAILRRRVINLFLQLYTEKSKTQFLAM